MVLPGAGRGSTAGVLMPTPAIPLQALHDLLLQRMGLRVSVLRLDLTHPLISGNKWFKLKHNLQQARAAGHDVLLSFGGTYSNHIHALAAAGQAFGFRTIGVIRGERPPQLSATLRFAEAQGMQLHFVSREQYRQKNSPELRAELAALYGEAYWLPEGGSNALAVEGCAEIAALIPADVDVVACACGTGGTLAGLASGLAGRAEVLGVAVLKGADFLHDEVRRLLAAANRPDPQNWRLLLDAHWGGYGRAPEALLAFIRQFEQQHGLPLEQVYTGKLFAAVWRLIEDGQFAPGRHVMLIHSGGLQGRLPELSPGLS